MTDAEHMKIDYGITVSKNLEMRFQLDHKKHRLLKDAAAKFDAVILKTLKTIENLSL